MHINISELNVTEDDSGKFLTSVLDRSLTCVCFHVLIKILLHVEVFAAPLAHELLVSDVYAHVGAELVLVLEALVAVLKQRWRTEEDTGKQN